MPAGAADAVFVGAGINTLAAALVLAEAGWRVVVLERAAEPGGAVRTLELTRPGFRHDLGAMNLSGLAGTAFFAAHRAALARHGVALAVADHAFGSVFPGGRFLGVGPDLDATLDAIAACAPGDAQAWRRWREDFDRLSPALVDVLAAPAPPRLEALPGAVRDLLTDSLRHQLTARFASEEVRALVAAWGMHPGFAPDTPGGVWMPFLETNAGERHGISVARGGSGCVPAALAGLIREAGGEVRTDAAVARVLVEDGRACGVALEDGSVVRATRAVVAGVTPPASAALVGDALPAPAQARAAAWRHGPGTLVVHLALSGPVPWSAPGARRSFYVHVGPTLDHLAAAHRQAADGLLPAEPFCVVGQPTLVDPSRAPAGAHVLWIMVRGVPAAVRGDAAGRIPARDWSAGVAAAFAERVLDTLARHAPGLRERVLAQAVHTPVDLERLNPNLVGGDTSGGADPRLGPGELAPHATGLPGLLLCGASTWPGGSTRPASGLTVAAALLAAG